MKELLNKGIGEVIKSADPITSADEEKLWQLNAIDVNTVSVLSCGVFFYNCKLFGLRNYDEYHELNLNQYVFSADAENCETIKGS